MRGSSKEQAFINRQQAGRRLAGALHAYGDHQEVVVIGLLRGGAVVAAALASALHVQFDVMNVKKISVPGQPELAMGAIASGGSAYLHPDVIETLSVGEDEIRSAVRAAANALERRRRMCGGLSLPDLTGKTVILTDDGIAPGSSMRAAIKAARRLGAGKVVVAVPVCAKRTADLLENQADEFISLNVPGEFFAVGDWYENFSEVNEDQVCALLEQHRGSGAAQVPA